MRIFLILELFHCTLPAGAYRMHRRVPAEERQVKAKREAYFQQAFTVVINAERLIIDIYRGQLFPPGTTVFGDVPLDIRPKMRNQAFQRRHGARRQCAKRMSHPDTVDMMIQHF